MIFIKKALKNTKGSSLVEKILVSAFSITAGAAIILYISNVVLEHKTIEENGILDGNFERNQSISEAEGTEGIHYTLQGDAYNVTGYTGNSASIVIPSTYNGKKVKEIGTYIFGQRSEITSVRIGSGITTIGAHCFQNCTYATSLSIPDSVTTIGADAFSGCMNLTSVTIPKNLARLEESVFYCCALNSLNIPNSVTYIGAAAFQHNKFSSLYIPATVTNIGNSPFFDCKNLTHIECAAPSKPSGFSNGWNFAQYGEGGTGIFYDVIWGV